MRYRKHFSVDVDEDEAVDENGVVRDGYGVVVPLMAVDAATPPRRPAARSTRLHDGHGGTPGHRPGFVMSDATNDERQRAYDAYQRDILSAWRGGDAQARDPRGCEARTDEAEREAGVESRDVLPRRDGMTLDERRALHRQRMAREYLAYDHRIAQLWRNG